MEPRIPWADERAIGGDRLEALEVRLDAVAHVVVKPMLLGVEIRRRDKGQPHVRSTMLEKSNGATRDAPLRNGQPHAKRLMHATSDALWRCPCSYSRRATPSTPGL